MSNLDNYNEFLDMFFDESFNLLENIEKAILELEKDNKNSEMINEIFRAVHSIKGSSATMELHDIAQFAHHFEDSLDFIRCNPQYEITSEIIDIILEGFDVLRNMIEAKYNNQEFNEDVSGVEEKLNSIPSILSEVNKDIVVKEKENNHNEDIELENFDVNFILTDDDIKKIKENVKENRRLLVVKVAFSKDDPMASVGPIQVYSSLRDLGLVVKTDPPFDELQKNKFFRFTGFLFISDKDDKSIKDFIFIPETVENLQIIQKDPSEFISKELSEQEKLEKKAKEIVERNEKELSEKELKREEEKKVEEKRVEERKEEKKIGKKLKEETEAKENSYKSSSGKPRAILRVDSGRIDELLNLVSQLVINKASLQEVIGKFSVIQEYESIFENLIKLILGLETADDREKFTKNITEKIVEFFKVLKSTNDNLKNEMQNHARIINLLQEGVMKIRMVPVNQLFARFPRIIRDLSRKLGKNVKLELEGEDTELDKSIIEELTDPLMHIIRNSMDHGIETPDIRISKGKPEIGTIKVSAKNEGNIIYIEIKDDGKGIDPELVRKKAIEKGLINAEANLTDKEIYELIMAPGFSTAEKVSDVSGRGVGMDVVKKGIEELNGTLSIDSEKDKGTTILIKLPLTLAIIQALMVNVGGEIFAIPINTIFETKRISDDEIFKIEDKTVIKIREEIISIIFVKEIFKIKKDEKAANDNLYIVVVNVGDTKIGLVVDALIGEQDLVIKPLNNKLTKVPGIAGAAILGNGDISLIIDVNQMVDYLKELDKKEITMNEE